jgi:hypothetical protein
MYHTPGLDGCDFCYTRKVLLLEGKLAGVVHVPIWFAMPFSQIWGCSGSAEESRVHAAATGTGMALRFELQFDIGCNTCVMCTYATHCCKTQTTLRMLLRPASCFRATMPVRLEAHFLMFAPFNLCAVLITPLVQSLLRAHAHLVPVRTLQEGKHVHNQVTSCSGPSVEVHLIVCLPQLDD